jgi:hypothetical protein
MKPRSKIKQKKFVTHTVYSTAGGKSGYSRPKFRMNTSTRTFICWNCLKAVQDERLNCTNPSLHTCTK